jgi:thiamine-monophosphate kinase
LLGPAATVADLTERDLLARIERLLPPAPSWLLVGIGDDAAVVQPERNRVEVLSVDALIEDVHFDRRFTPPEAIGHRALAVNLSDLAAMGAEPRLALLSLALPPSLACADFDAMAQAASRLAAQFKLHIVGGNLTRSPGPLMLDVTVSGTAKRRGVLTRRGARAGDGIYVTGTLGAAAAGLQILRARCDVGRSQVAPRKADTPVARLRAADPIREDRPGSLDGAAVDSCTARYLYPEPRVRAGLFLGRSRAASACIDLSDGLADGVRQIAASSGVGMVIEGDALPIDRCARAWFQSRGVDPLIEAVTSGDDYELTVAVPPRRRGRLAHVIAHAGVRFTRIGVCTEGRDLVLRRTIGGRVVEQAMPEGFSHFR